jgi:hypothetical protein
VGVPRDAAVAHRHRHRPGQPGAVGQFPQQRGARARDKVAAIGGYTDTGSLMTLSRE